MLYTFVESSFLTLLMTVCFMTNTLNYTILMLHNIIYFAFYIVIIVVYCLYVPITNDSFWLHLAVCLLCFLELAFHSTWTLLIKLSIMLVVYSIESYNSSCLFTSSQTHWNSLSPRAGNSGAKVAGKHSPPPQLQEKNIIHWLSGEFIDSTHWTDIRSQGLYRLCHSYPISSAVEWRRKSTGSTLRSTCVNSLRAWACWILNYPLCLPKDS